MQDWVLVGSRAGAGGSEVLRDLVSSLRHITRSVRVSRTMRSCTLSDKGYEAYGSERLFLVEAPGRHVKCGSLGSIQLLS